MLILTNDNTTIDLIQLGQELTENIHFGIFDFSEKNNYDYFFRPLIVREQFNNVTILFQIGHYKTLLPIEWSIVLADPETGDIELIPVKDINTRNFHVFTFNPLNGGLHRFYPLKAIDIFTDVCWTVPKIALGSFLLAPLSAGAGPECIFIVNEKEQRKIPPLEIGYFN